jgi:3-oxoacyl-[acyl-carrier-protein] synthase-3
MTSLTHLSYFIPKVNYSNSKILKKDIKNKIINKIGIDKKFKTRKDQFASDLSIASIKKILVKNNFKNKIDFFINCTQSNDYVLPGNSTLIQKKLSLNKIPCVDLNIGCSGFVYSLCLAKSLIETNVAKCVLITTSDTYSKFIDIKDANVSSIFGDAAASCILEKSKQKKNIGIFDLGSDGEGFNDLIVRNRALKKEQKFNNRLSMNGPAMFSFAIREVPKTILNTLKKNKLKKEDIDYFILHQANLYMLDSIREKLDIEKKKILNFIDYGNTTSSTIPIVLHQAIKEKKIRKGNRILICGFGLGASWSSTIITISQDLINNIS